MGLAMKKVRKILDAIYWIGWAIVHIIMELIGV
jgi:hypothetical protein